MIDDKISALSAIESAWPTICDECRQVLGSELQYQAMIYHALRAAGGIPATQLAMNVKQWIPDVKSELFINFQNRKHEHYRGGFEPIPDVVIFSPGIRADWRRRRWSDTIKHMLAVIEVKASERHGGRLSRAEIVRDIQKLAAHREEARYLGHDFHPIMVVLDVASDDTERMRPSAIAEARSLANALGVEWRYLDPTMAQVDRVQDHSEPMPVTSPTPAPCHPARPASADTSARP